MELTILISGILIFIVTCVIIFIIFGRRKREVKIYLVGCAGSGKTKLFYYLSTKQILPTLTSQSRNQYQIELNDKKGNLIDLPGHPRIRTEVMNSIKDATAIIFVIDSQTALEKMSDIGNFVYDILIEEQIYKRKVPILIVGSKSDLSNARSIDMISSELENELDYIRKNRQRSTYVENNEDSTLFLGQEDTDFSFSQLSNSVTFCACSVNTEKVEDVLDFIKLYLH